MPATKRRTHKRTAARRKPVAIVRVQPPVLKPWELTEEQKAILKNAICKGASDDEMKYCLEVSRRYKLDPFKGQIWFIPRWDRNADNGQGGKGRLVYVPQVSIYGLLHIAARDHADYGSISLPEYGPMTSIEVEGKAIKGPEWARVKVWKKGLSEPTEGEAYLEEYCPKKWENTLFWRTMGRRMIAKCAKAQAVREAYPDLGGLSIPEEMEKLNENFSPSGREILTEAPTGTLAAAQEVGLRRAEEMREKIEARKYQPSAAQATGGSVVSSTPEPSAFRGTIELDWSVNEASPVLRGDIAEQLETLKLNLHMVWGADNWWHCEPRDLETLIAICRKFGYELKQTLPREFPGRDAASKTPLPTGKAAAEEGSTRAGNSSADGPKQKQSVEAPKHTGNSVQEAATAPKAAGTPKTSIPKEKARHGLPAARIPCVVKSVQKTKSGKGLEVTLDTGAKLYAFDNRKMGEDGEKMLDLLATATGKECIFATQKNKTTEGREFTNIVGLLQMGEREWDEGGMPILRRDPPTMREPGED